MFTRCGGTARTDVPDRHSRQMEQIVCLALTGEVY